MASPRGTVDLDGVKDAELPSDFRGMDKPSLKNELAKRAKTRQAAQKEIEALAKQRTEYLSTQGASKPDGLRRRGQGNGREAS